jgi:ribosome biogenesis GTPase
VVAHDPVSTVLASLGLRPEDHLEVPDGLLLGRVAIVHGALAEVIVAGDDDDERQLLLSCSKVQPRLVAGDWVGVAGERIAWVSPRRSELRRPASSKRRVQILAANLDLVLITVPVDRPLNLVLLESFAVMAFDSGARPVVVLTKADEIDDPGSVISQVRAAVEEVDVLVTSSSDGSGIDELRTLLRSGVTAVMLGASGVGKTSLLNVLDDRHELVRSLDRRGEGRHSTTTRKLHRLTSGGVLLDIPGIRLLDAVVSDEGLAATFPEIEALTEQCRFRDCAHQGDKGCAVERALRMGEISERRLASWRQRRAAGDEPAHEHGSVRRSKRRGQPEPPEDG